jgi:hypothetical protein
MQLAKLLLFWTLIAAFGCIDAAQGAETLTFQGLGGRSREADFLSRFPNATARSSCGEGETVSRFADGLYQCRYFILDSYSVGEVDFDLSAFFFPNGTLKAVFLTDGYGAPYVYSRSIDTAQIYRRHKLLKDLLVQKYGPASQSEQISKTTDLSEWYLNYWHLGEMTIKLSTRFSRSSHENPWRGKISITYEFVEESPASKL